MNDHEGETITDVIEVIDKDFYSSKKPEELETYGEDFNDVEDTVIRMILDSQ